MYLAKSAPFRPSGTFPRFAGEGLDPRRHCIRFPASQGKDLIRGATAFPSPASQGEDLIRGATAFPFPASQGKDLIRGATASVSPLRRGRTRSAAPLHPFPRFAGEGLDPRCRCISLPLRAARGKVPKAEGGAFGLSRKSSRGHAFRESTRNQKASGRPSQNYSGQQRAFARMTTSFLGRNLSRVRNVPLSHVTRAVRAHAAASLSSARTCSLMSSCLR
jgi:hypothetical protein